MNHGSSVHGNHHVVQPVRLNPGLERLPLEGISGCMAQVALLSGENDSRCFCWSQL